MGIVHRDVSPQNIIVSFSGNVKLVDFGIAKAATKIAHTRAGVLKGKYTYMSPEQAEGQVVDARTDQFALGIVLWELLTMRRLFKRESETLTLEAIIDGHVDDWARLVGVTPPCPADFTRDGGVDGDDVTAFFAAWEAGAAGADVNLDGSVDGVDVSVFFSNWEAGC
jgi:serine/threonine protein kinase